MGLSNPSHETKFLRRERGQGNIGFPWSGDDEQDWQPYPVDPDSCFCVTIHNRVLYGVLCNYQTPGDLFETTILAILLSARKP